MRVFAYCAKSFENVTKKAAGVQPVLSPPASVYNFDLAQLATCDLLYIDLHGLPGESFWLGDDRTIAMTATELRKADLWGVIVFATNCYLADENSPMLDALFDAGARYVIGGDGKNWAGDKWAVMGAGLLGLWFRRLWVWGMPPLKALALAKKRVAWGMAGRANKHLAAKDTLEFRAYYREVT